MKHLSDEELLSRYYGNADSDSLETFLARHMNYMKEQARYFVRNEDIEDIVQASMIRLMDAKPIDGAIRNGVGWWHSMLATSAIDHLRSTERRRKRENLLVQDLTDSSRDVEDDAIKAELLQQIRNAVARLNRSQSDPLILRYFMGLSYKEIAATMELNVSTVSTRIARGLNTLRASLSSNGATNSKFHSTAGESHMPVPNEQINHDFIDSWNNRWYAYLDKHDDLCGIGHWFAHEDERTGFTQVGQDVCITREPCVSGYPEKEKLSVSMRETIELSDVNTLDWNSYEFQLTPSVGYRKQGVEDSSITIQKRDDALMIKDDGEQHFLRAPDGELVLPQAFAPLFICAQERVQRKAFPFKLVGFDLIDRKRVWSDSEFSATYVGQKGAPTGLYPTYEFRYPNRLVTIWSDERKRFAGFNGDRETELVFQSEQLAREYLQSRT